jgi:cyclase
LDVVEKTAAEVFVPLTVGGGIRNVDDVKQTLRAGADKVGINSAAVKNKRLISEAAAIFGSQCVVVAIDAKLTRDGWHVFISGGRIDTGIDALKWAMEAEKLGAGEILLTSMDADGTKNGFDIPLTKAVAANVGIPVIASGGAGKLEDFYDIFTQTEASAALAASLFHYKETDVASVKKYLAGKGVNVRL